MDDFQINDVECPNCGHHVTHSMQCTACDEAHEVVECCDDLCVGAGHCMHGDGMASCPDCAGTGIQRWCPKCSQDYWVAKWNADRSAKAGNGEAQ